MSGGPPKGRGVNALFQGSNNPTFHDAVEALRTAKEAILRARADGMDVQEAATVYKSAEVPLKLKDYSGAIGIANEATRIVSVAAEEEEEEEEEMEELIDDAPEEALGQVPNEEVAEEPEAGEPTGYVGEAPAEEEEAPEEEVVEERTTVVKPPPIPMWEEPAEEAAEEELGEETVEEEVEEETVEEEVEEEATEEEVGEEAVEEELGEETVEEEVEEETVEEEVGEEAGEEALEEEAGEEAVEEEAGEEAVEEEFEEEAAEEEVAQEAPEEEAPVEEEMPVEESFEEEHAAGETEVAETGDSEAPVGSSPEEVGAEVATADAGEAGGEAGGEDPSKEERKDDFAAYTKGMELMKAVRDSMAALEEKGINTFHINMLLAEAQTKQKEGDFREMEKIANEAFMYAQFVDQIEGERISEMLKEDEEEE